MDHFVTQRSVLTAPFMLLIAFSVMGALMLQSPATAATDVHCRLPHDAAADRTIAQTGKARPAVATQVMALPVGVTRKQAHYARGIVPASPISYVRCMKNPV